MADRGESPPRSDLVYGLQPVREALRGRRRVREIVCTSEAAAAMPWIEASGVRMSIAVADRVTALAERPDHQGVVAICDPYPYADAHALLARPDALVVAWLRPPRSWSRSTVSPTPATSAPSCARASASALTAS
jgi:tRNA G18 (ribose-2'-O)-methylase SpoU